MRIWAVVLRTLGTAMILLTVNETLTVARQFPDFYRAWGSLSAFLMPTLEHLVFAALCFGGASGLMTLRQIRGRQLQGAARRNAAAPERAPAHLPRLTWDLHDTQPIDIPAPPARTSADRSDLAPDAPNWSALPEPLPLSDGADQRLEREVKRGVGSLLNAPTVREAPAPSRVTPGTEAQYADTPMQPARARRDVANPYLRNRPPLHLPEDRDLLRAGRDRQLRRKFMDEG